MPMDTLPLATASAGLPIGGSYVEYSGSASATSTDLIASTDVRAYRSWSLQLTGAWSANLQVQGSNDNTNWFYIPSSQALGTSSPFQVTTLSTTGIFCGPVVSRYMRVRTTSYTSGTVTATLELTVEPGAFYNNVYIMGTTGALSITNNAVAADGQSNGFSFPVHTEGYNGSTWDRVRIPSIVKTATPSASGSTTVWTPTTGKKWRLLRYMVSCGGGTNTGSNQSVNWEFKDAATSFNTGQGLGGQVYLSTTAVYGGWSTGWVDLGNGYLSSTTNNALNFTLSAAVTSGNFSVVVCGVEE